MSIIGRTMAALVRPPIEDDEAASRSGLLRGVAPFSVAFLIGLAFFPAVDRPVGPLTVVGVAIPILVVLAALVVPWTRLPSGTMVVLPVACIVAVGVMRHAEGGPSSGWSPLAFLPMLWVAVYGSRRELLLALVVLASVFIAPIVLIGAPVYGPLEWRRGLLHFVAGGFVAYGVQEVMRSLRERARLASDRDAMLSTVLRTLPDMLTLRDAEGRLVMANPIAEEALGVKAGETPNRLALEPGDREVAQAFFDDVVGGAEGRTMRVRFRQRDGRIRWFDARGAALDLDGRRHALVLSQDVTAQVELLEDLRTAKERAEAADQAKSEFLSRMSHELRTPLNAILGFGQLLELSPDLLSEDRESAERVVRGGRHLLALINDILDISNIEAGRLEISLEPVSVAEIVRESMAMVEPQAGAKGITLAPPPEDDVHVRADRQRLRQALVNLLSNAVKYNRPGGSVSVEVATEGEVSRIAVRDDGRGIPESMRDRLFQPFQRLGAEATGVEGTGIGLALTKRLVEAMGGSIGVESVVGTGSTFWIALPVEVPDREAHPEPQRPLLQVGATDHVRTLLYIEDNVVNLQLIEQLVSRQPGLRLLPALHGSLGLELARQHRPDAILLDVHLPDMPGWEVLAQLRAAPETAGIPVVLISADATERQVQRFLEAGARHYLTKPIDVRRLLTVLEEILPPDGLPGARQPASTDGSGSWAGDASAAQAGDGSGAAPMR